MRVREKEKQLELIGERNQLLTTEEKDWKEDDMDDAVEVMESEQEEVLNPPNAAYTIGSSKGSHREKECSEKRTGPNGRGTREQRTKSRSMGEIRQYTGG